MTYASGTPLWSYRKGSCMSQTPAGLHVHALLEGVQGFTDQWTDGAELPYGYELQLCYDTNKSQVVA